MKIFTSIIFLFLTANLLFSQTSLPNVEIKDMNGNTFNTSQILKDSSLIVVDFWATWCKPCIKVLEAVNENYEDWQEEFDFKFYAISIDNARSMGRVLPFANGHGWEFEILLDPNSDFKRAMNVINIPHTFIINKKGEIVWQHATYAEGDEEELYELLLKLSKGESIE